MPIPTHQVHNVLTAYARRLHHRRASGPNGNVAESEAFDQRRRTLIQRMTTRYIDKMIHGHADRSQQMPMAQTSLSDDQLIYHQMDAVNGKTIRCLNHQPGAPPNSNRLSAGKKPLPADTTADRDSGLATPLLPDGLHPEIK